MPCEAVTSETSGLWYVTETDGGIRREQVDDGFIYRDERGRIVSDEGILGRIRSLAIPPAWTDVWICPHADGHLQATGRDARGRKQYRYHPAWRELCEANKFDRLAAFGRALPAIRRRTDEDLCRRGMSKDKVVALVVRLLDETLLRVGNEEYARANEAYGLTTLRDHHAEIDGNELRLLFKGKGGKTQSASVRNRRLARAVRRSQELPGEVLFQYLHDEGQAVPITSGDVNEYLRSVAGEEFSAKDFRTWGGTLAAARELAAAAAETEQRAKEASKRARGASKRGGRQAGGPTPGPGRREVTQTVNRALDSAAALLGNTRAVARRSYVHPDVLAAYKEGTLTSTWRRRGRRRKNEYSLSVDEQALLRLLEQRRST